MAAAHNNVECVRILLERKSPLDVVDVRRASRLSPPVHIISLFTSHITTAHTLLNPSLCICCAVLCCAVLCCAVLCCFAWHRLRMDWWMDGLQMVGPQNSGKSALIHLSSHWDEKHYQAMQWMVEAGCRLDQGKIGELMLCSVRGGELLSR